MHECVCVCVTYCAKDTISFIRKWNCSLMKGLAKELLKHQGISERTSVSGHKSDSCRVSCRIVSTLNDKKGILLACLTRPRYLVVNYTLPYLLMEMENNLWKYHRQHRTTYTMDGQTDRQTGCLPASRTGGILWIPEGCCMRKLGIPCMGFGWNCTFEQNVISSIIPLKCSIWSCVTACVVNMSRIRQKPLKP